LMDHMKTLWGSWCIGVVEKEDIDKATERGMKDLSGFKWFFGGLVQIPCPVRLPGPRS
jgi:N-acyl-phosphatidylethanolamine-hydrolysing phospholipase D